MSQRGHWWWGAIQAALRLYPELRQRYGTPDNRVTAQYTAQTSCGGAGRVVKQLAMERLSDGDYAVYMAISDAVRETARMGTGDARLAIIDLVYWRRTRTLQGAALDVGYSYDRAKDFHMEFIRLVAYHMGYIPRNKIKRKRNVTPQSPKPVRK